MPRKKTRRTPRKKQSVSATRKPDTPRPISLVEQHEIDEYFSKKSLLWIQWQLKNKEYISGEDLATAIEANPGKPLPAEMRNYLCKLLRGEIRKKRGPQKKPFSYNNVLNDVFDATILPTLYQEELRHFQRLRKTQVHVKGNRAPHELAIRAIRDRFKRYAMITPQRLANILSSRKLGR